MIDFEHVSKQYKHNAKPALEDVNFHVDDGEFVFLLGHSGAGKSTLLKLILREETPTEGRVLVNGQDVARLRRRKIPYLRRQMGIIFQDFRLIVHRLPAFEIQVDGQIGILEFQLELDGSSSDTSVSIGGHFS